VTNIRTCRCNRFGLPHRPDQCLSTNPSDGVDDGLVEWGVWRTEYADHGGES
jgi:hypothetical protein